MKKAAIKTVISYRLDPRLSPAYDVFYASGRVKTYFADDLPATVQAFCDGALTELIRSYCLRGFPACKFTRPEWT